MPAGRPPLSYSLPAFRVDGYEKAARWLERLRDLGFRWVTFHPTCLVHDETPVRLDLSTAPRMHDAFACARSFGFQIILEPHLDWASTLTGGPYEWRRRMYLDPGGAYASELLESLAALAPDALTLGSELDVSLYEFPAEWAKVAARFAGVRLGHKLNHDAFSSGQSCIRSEVKSERQRHNLPASDSRRFGTGLAAYLSALDYVAFSFYPSGSFEWAASRMYHQLRQLAPGPDFAVGEFGLGSSDTSRPWHCDAASLKQPESISIRRTYYLKFLHWLRDQTYTASPVTFWTVGHFDFLGVLEQPGCECFEDDVLRRAVMDYNLET
jgi:hypothetical protein